MNRAERTEIAKETLEIVDRGSYVVDQTKVELGSLINNCLKHTRYYSPSELSTLRDRILGNPTMRNDTKIEVVNETTLSGLARLYRQHSSDPIGVLNFASAKNPGGGFLRGSQAQEESLARSSALVRSLEQATEFYELHRQETDYLYSDSIIVSPNCPVFRDDYGVLLLEPNLATFITCPAPNAGAIPDRNPVLLSRVSDTLRSRAELILAIAAHYRCSDLVLGAWGCGVFRNDPKTVANIFAEHLHQTWAGRFRSVTFSIFDNSADLQTLEIFRASLCG